MTDKETALIKKSVKEWNAWRKDNPDIYPDLCGADLRNADLEDANLVGTNLRNANLEDAKR